ncbi:MAG TPA: hypothetical protein VMJ75_13065 [Candidatus Acidoferrales bacterium]|nr:hypothetical protein [Candidatus Acidoferrales bacterium]
MRDLLEALGSTQARTRLRASKALREFSRREPAAVYPYFDVFAGLLGHENNILKWNAIRTLAHLAPVDREGKLDCLLDAYLAPIRGPVMITAANTIQGAALIAGAKPQLADRIAKRILGVEKAKYATPECRNVAIGHALVALEKMAALVPDTGSIRAFAARQMRNSRAATARKAERALRALRGPKKPMVRATRATTRARSSALASGSRTRS